MLESWIPLVWAQAAGAAGGTATPSVTTSGVGNPAALAFLAVRRWCSGLTLSSPQVAPGLEGLWSFLAGLAVLLLLSFIVQGPLPALKQLFDLPGHLALVRRATQRLWRAGRTVAALITFTVLAWTGSQTLSFLTETSERGKADLALLTKSRGKLEIALEQGIFAGLTPLRDLAGLADNMPLLICAVYLVFRASSGMLPPIGPAPGRMGNPSVTGKPLYRSRGVSGWATMIWGCGGLYALYRFVARAAGSSDLPIGGCLVAEAIAVPFMMLICDGFLLAWVLSEIRNAGFDNLGEDRIHPFHALELMPAAALACLLALPARYVATLVFLASQHLPTSAAAGTIGSYVRWQLGWGLIDFQAASLVTLGLVGVVAWSRGSIEESLTGFGRLLRSQAGHLIGIAAMASTVACLLASLAYAVMLLLPAAGWVLSAADSYAHFVTLPVGLWTLAALIELAERSLPVASVARPASESHEGSEVPVGAVAEFKTAG
jgi:hypothetical protein